MAAGDGKKKISTITALGAAFLLFLFAFVALNAFNFQSLNPSTTGEIVIFGGLSAAACLLFIAVLVLLARNVLKLYADQRTSMMGTRLRTRMLWGAVLVSVIPLIFMFMFSYGLMNRAVDRWFSQDPNEMRNDANQLAKDLAQYSSSNAHAEAQAIAAALSAHRPKGARGPDDMDTGRAKTVLAEHEITLQNGFAVIYRADRPAISFHVPHPGGASAQIKPWVAQPSGAGGESAAVAAGPSDGGAGGDIEATILSAARQTDQSIFSFSGTDYALGIAPVQQDVSVVVGLPMPNGMSHTVSGFQNAIAGYWNAYRQRRQVRSAYIFYLLAITSIALFACCWLALHLAKQVTRPVESLADAMQAIAAGNYSHRVAESATEELGELVRSFNTMAADLEGSRQAVETSTAQLSTANSALEARRRELETMLETIPNGVATLDAQRRIVLANRALTEMLDPGGKTPFLGVPMENIFPADAAEAKEQLDHLLRRSHRMGSASGEMEIKVARGNGGAGVTMYVLATVALLETEHTHQGYVLVLENATELLRAQKQSAWKEVARRVAHEIKNPLTPIALSSEQIHRHVGRVAATLQSAGLESSSITTIRKSSEVITSSVETMRTLVDQFSALAEFPAAQPRPADLNTIVENCLAIFVNRLQSIRLVRSLTPGLPLVSADPEALKRALGNLIDNAAEAMQNSLLRELHIATALLPSGMVELCIADTGSGLTDEMRERLFLPYFSTKQRGTGLGLAIAAKIIQEHQGTIRAEKNTPAGAKFILELRPAISTTDGEEAQPSAAEREYGDTNREKVRA